MTDRAYIEVRPRAANINDVTPIRLRGGDEKNVRLTFLPSLVCNPSEPDACVNGTFAYERRAASGHWEPAEAIRLSSLTAGQGVRIRLTADEILHLFKALAALYELYDEDGLKSHLRRYLLVDARSPERELLELAKNRQSRESLRAMLDWIGEQSAESVTAIFQADADMSDKLDCALGIARLGRFIESADRLLVLSVEGDWQKLLQDEPWALGQIYAQAVVFLKGQAYVGGKNIDGRGGNIADFVYVNEFSTNCLVVEIKRPDTPLMIPPKRPAIIR